MNTRSNQIVVGIILFLIGICLLSRSYFNINYGTITIIVGGFSLLLLYKTKRKSWALVCGLFLTFIGLANISFLQPIASYLFGAMFFLVPGIIFLILFYDKNKRALLIPGSILFWLGVSASVSGLFYSLGIPTPSILFYLGLSFIMIYLLGKSFLGNWPVIVGAVFLFLSLPLPRFFSFGSTVRHFPQLFPVLLILASICIIIKAVRNKKENNDESDRIE